MISIQSPEVRERIAGWQTELRDMTKDETVKLVPVVASEVNLSLVQIAETVIFVTGIEYHRLCSKSRKREIVLARFLVCYLSYKKNHISWKDIGEYLGGRDHTSAMHGHKAITDFLDAGDSATVRYVEEIGVYLGELKKRIANGETN